MHRDLKPANILLHDGVAKIGDFGCGKIVDNCVDQAFLQSYKCTVLYASP